MSIKKIILGLSLALIGTQAQAVPCSQIDTGVFLSGGATASSACVDGTGANDPFPSDLIMSGMTFEALQKSDWDPVSTDTVVDIDLSVTPTGAAPSGTWSFTNIAAYDSYVIVLKDGGAFDLTSGASAQWAAYLLDSTLFDATTGSTWSGDWIYGYNDKGKLKDISHLSVYGKLSRTTVPEPGVLALLGLGLVGFSLRKLKK